MTIQITIYINTSVVCQTVSTIFGKSKDIMWTEGHTYRMLVMSARMATRAAVVHPV